MHSLGLAVTIVVLVVVSCSAETAESALHKFVVVGSTACDESVRSQLGIPVDTKCDFIRWHLTLDETRGKTFTLDANYGEGQPNTTGFVGGGKRLSASGPFEVTQTPGSRDVYRLKSANPPVDVSLAKLNTNLFHVVEPSSGSMLVGNGGWSYTLNRSPAVATAATVSAITDARYAPRDIFVGRTPCREIADQAGLPHGSDCFKLKWKLTLNRDATTAQPTTFTIESTFAREKPVSGKWSRVTNGNAIVYRLEPDASIKAISLLLVDGAHLLVLDAAGRPLVGNADFSYTLDRGQ